jgi:hypothetical protein
MRLQFDLRKNDQNHDTCFEALAKLPDLRSLAPCGGTPFGMTKPRQLRMNQFTAKMENMLVILRKSISLLPTCSHQKTISINQLTGHVAESFQSSLVFTTRQALRAGADSLTANMTPRSAFSAA